MHFLWRSEQAIKLTTATKINAPGAHRGLTPMPGTSVAGPAGETHATGQFCLTPCKYLQMAAAYNSFGSSPRDSVLTTIQNHLNNLFLVFILQSNRVHIETRLWWSTKCQTYETGLSISDHQSTMHVFI